jgi:hypothetical protein
MFASRFACSHFARVSFPSRTKEYLLPSLIALAVLAANFFFPFFCDSDIYHSMAMDLVRYGKLPYIDSWDLNFPGIVYLHALSITLFGPSDTGFRLFDTIVQVVLALPLYRYATEMWGRSAGLWAVGLYSLYYIDGYWWTIGQRDGYMGFCVLLAALPYLRGERISSNMRLVITGLLIGSAFLIRPTALAVAPIIFYFQRDLRSILIIVASSLILPVAAFVPYLFIDGGLEQVYRSLVDIHLTVYGGMPSEWTKLIQRPWIRRAIIAGFVGGAIMTLMHKRSHPTLRTLPFVAASFLGMLAMRKFFDYHWLPIFIFAVPLAALTLSRITQVGPKPVRIIAGLAILAMLFHASYPTSLAWTFFSTEGSITTRLDSVRALFAYDDRVSWTYNQQAADYVRKNTSTKNIELATVTPSLHWMLELDQPTRFTTMFPLGMVDSMKGRPEFQLRWREEYVNTLRAKRPEMIILVDGPVVLSAEYLKMTPAQAAREIPGFNALLDDHYKLDSVIAGYQFYKRDL